MAKQSLVSFVVQEELCDWEFINQFDFELEDDDESIYEVESIDLIQSLDSLSSCSSSSSEEEEEEEEERGRDDLDVNHDQRHVIDVVNCARVFDLGQNCDIDHVVEQGHDVRRNDLDVNHDAMIELPPHQRHLVDVVNCARVFDLGQNCDVRRNDLDANHDAMIESPLHHEHHVVDVVNCARVFDLGRNRDVDHVVEQGYDVDISDYVSRIYYGSHVHVYDDTNHVYHDDDGENDDGYDIDDELVPWEVKDRFERQRIRKSGKRAFAKMNKSKKSAVIYTRPGCVHGKHGLGLKAF